MASDVKYSRLPTNPDAEESLKPKNKKFAVPKITRLKVGGVVFVIIFVAVTIFISCIKSSHSQESVVCNLSNDKNVVISETEERTYGYDHVRLKHMKKKLPQCLIIGVRKAGTRALLKYLNIHPDVVAKGAESHFFDDDEEYDKSLEYYRREMPPSFDNQITVEKTPAYFTEYEVPERVYRMNNSIKLLLILREPVERLLSDYLQFKEGKIKQSKPFESFENRVIDKNGNINKSYKGISRSVYHKHLKHWTEDLFNLNQIFIIESTELVQKPAAVMARVEDFLGLRHYIKPSHFYFNKTKGFYCIVQDDEPKCLAESKGREHPQIDPALHKKLKDFYAPHNEKLFHMIGRDFGWNDDIY